VRECPRRRIPANRESWGERNPQRFVEDGGNLAPHSDSLLHLRRIVNILGPGRFRPTTAPRINTTSRCVKCIFLCTAKTKVRMSHTHTYTHTHARTHSHARTHAQYHTHTHNIPNAESLTTSQTHSHTPYTHTIHTPYTHTITHTNITHALPYDHKSPREPGRNGVGQSRPRTWATQQALGLSS
jgi:hypothetical protein